MSFKLDQAMEILRRTPAALRAQLDGLSDSWVMTNYGPDTFSPYDVVGHLVHGEKSDWIARAGTILEHGESKTFEPFDRYAMYEDSRGKSMGDLLDEFSRLRAGNLRTLEAMSLDDAALARRGMHPELGSVTLEQLLATWAAHDLHHLAQICKAMARQYLEACGPWRAYLGIMG